MLLSSKMPFEIHDKGQREVDQYRRAKGQERSVDKKQAYTGSRYMHDASEHGADAKSLIFDEILELSHF